MEKVSMKENEQQKGASARVSPEQREIMLHFMEEHPELARNQFSGPPGVIKRQTLWRELVERLHATLTGARKPVDKWVKCWHDWKSDTKSKAQRLWKQEGGTRGGQTLKCPALTDAEERLLKMLGRTSSVVIEGVQDPLRAQVALEVNPFTSRQPSAGPPFIQSIHRGISEALFIFPNECSDAQTSLPPFPSTSKHPQSPANVTPPLPRKEPQANRSRKRKRSSFGDTLFKERLAAAIEGRTAAMQQIANTFSEVGESMNRLTDELIKTLMKRECNHFD